MPDNERPYVSEASREQYNQAVAATSALVKDVGVATRDRPLEEAIRMVGQALALRAVTSPGMYISTMPHETVVSMLETVRAGRIAAMPSRPKAPE